MSSLASEDPWCKNQADILSCNAMKILAQKEEKENRNISKYLIENPECNRFQQLADRKTEISLQAYGINRKTCYNPDSINKDGDWVKQFGPLIQKKYEFFDEWTRPR